MVSLNDIHIFSVMVKSISNWFYRAGLLDNTSSSYRSTLYGKHKFGKYAT